MFTSLFPPSSDHVMIKLKVTCTTVQIILSGTTDYIGACTNRSIINCAAMGRAVINLPLVYYFFYVGDQTQTSTQPNCVRDFESCNL